MKCKDCSGCFHEGCTREGRDHYVCACVPEPFNIEDIEQECVLHPEKPGLTEITIHAGYPMEFMSSEIIKNSDDTYSVTHRFKHKDVGMIKVNYPRVKMIPRAEWGITLSVSSDILPFRFEVDKDNKESQKFVLEVE